MQTTSIYIEHIIIGAEVSAWIYALFCLIDRQAMNLYSRVSSSVIASVALLILCYVIGLLFDRIWDWMFDLVFGYPEDTVKVVLKFPKNVETYSVLDNDFNNFSLSRRRIIRGTAINAFLLGGFVFGVLLRHFSEYRILAWCIFAACIAVSVLCYLIYFKLIFDFYKKICKTYYKREKDDAMLADVRQVKFSYAMKAVAKARFKSKKEDKPKKRKKRATSIPHTS